MPRGGRRSNPGGRPFTWASGHTNAVRIPLVFLDEVLTYAKYLDKGNAPINLNEGVHNHIGEKRDVKPSKDEAIAKAAKLAKKSPENVPKYILELIDFIYRDE